MTGELKFKERTMKIDNTRKLVKMIVNSQSMERKIAIYTCYHKHKEAERLVELQKKMNKAIAKFIVKNFKERT